MLRLATFLALLVAPAAATAAQPQMIVSNYDGLRFEYGTALNAKGQVELTGHLLPGREPFRLIVDTNGRVHGDMAYSPVEFFVSPRQQQAIAARLTAATSNASTAVVNSVQAIAAAR